MFQKLLFLLVLMVMTLLLFVYKLYRPQHTIIQKEKKSSSSHTMWSHLVFINKRKQQIGKKTTISRVPTNVYGLFNQLFALFSAVDIATLLGRQKLVMSDFYVNFNNKTNHVPLSKIIQLGSLLIPTTDWCSEKEPQNLNYIETRSLDVLQKQNHVQDLEIGCCFMFPLPNQKIEDHIQTIRFHPIFYELVSSFLHTYPRYQVVHYRMENDFTKYFYKSRGFHTLKECREHLFHQYQKALKKKFDPNLPTLVVSHYYKDPQQPRDHDLQWNNLIDFSLTPQQKTQLYQHLGLPPSTPMREVDAIIDFILCTTPNVRSFIGCGGSTFTHSVRLFHNNQNCTMISWDRQSDLFTHIPSFTDQRGNTQRLSR